MPQGSSREKQQSSRQQQLQQPSGQRGEATLQAQAGMIKLLSYTQTIHDHACTLQHLHAYV